MNTATNSASNPPVIESITSLGKRVAVIKVTPCADEKWYYAPLRNDSQHSDGPRAGREAMDWSNVRVFLTVAGDGSMGVSRQAHGTTQAGRHFR